MQKITPHLWFDTQAEEAANHYVATFKNSSIKNITHYPDAAEEVSGKAPGSIMTVEFQLDGQELVALNGGKVPGFEFSPAISFMVSCETQDEIDHFWEKLSAVPEAEQCGWCKDKYGVTWQIVPAVLSKMLSDPDQSKVERVTSAFLQMKKFDIVALERAYSG